MEQRAAQHFFISIVWLFCSFFVQLWWTGEPRVWAWRRLDANSLNLVQPPPILLAKPPPKVFWGPLYLPPVPWTLDPLRIQANLISVPGLLVQYSTVCCEALQPKIELCTPMVSNASVIFWKTTKARTLLVRFWNTVDVLVEYFSTNE